MSKQSTSERTTLNVVDYLPEKNRVVERIKKALGGPAEFYGFEKIDLPVIENPKFFTPLFKGGIFGEHMPVVCRGRGGEETLLRPSIPFSVIRSYVSNKMNDLPHPLKFSFDGRVFFSKHSTPATVEEKLEWGVVMIGEEGPIAEAEIIQVIWRALEKLVPPERLRLRINAVGCRDCSGSYRSILTSFFKGRLSRLCRSCKRYAKHSPTKILQCLEERCGIASSQSPQVLDFLCEACKKHLRRVLEFLDEARIPYFLTPTFFNGGLWYDMIIFVVEYDIVGKRKEELKQEWTGFAEGGRMMRSAELLCGKRLDVTTGVVFLDRIGEFLFRKWGPSAVQRKSEVFFAHLGELAKRRGLALLEELRLNGISMDESLGRDSIKSQLKIAERLGSKVSLILGQKEAIDGTIIVREMESGIQESVPQDKLIEFLKRKLK